MFFFFNDTATTEIYTLSLHDALPIFSISEPHDGVVPVTTSVTFGVAGFTDDEQPQMLLSTEPVTFLYACDDVQAKDRKSTRLNSSHANISYAVFCLKKKIKITENDMF